MGYLRWAATQVSPPGQEKEIGAAEMAAQQALILPRLSRTSVALHLRPLRKGAAPGSPSRRAPLESCGVAKDLTSSNPQRASIRSHLS